MDDVNSKESSFSISDVEAELQRTKSVDRLLLIVKSLVVLLLVLAAVTAFAGLLFLPAFQISGDSMAPSLYEEDIVLSTKTKDIEPGDIISFMNNNKVLVKRVIAVGGDWINMDPDGSVYVNGVLQNEPYVRDRAVGDCDIELPYQVPEGQFFVMGDQRSISLDSRSSQIGCVTEQQKVRKIVFCVWPMNHIGKVN